MKRLSFVLVLSFGLVDVALADDINNISGSASNANAVSQNNGINAGIVMPRANATSNATGNAMSISGGGQGGAAQTFQGQSFYYAPTTIGVRPDRTILPPNGITPPIVSSPMFWNPGVAPNGAFLQPYAVLKVCNQPRVASDDHDKLQPIWDEDFDDLVTPVFTPYPYYLNKATRGQKIGVLHSSIETLPDGYYICLGSIMMQAKADEKPQYVNADYLKNLAETFVMKYLTGFHTALLYTSASAAAAPQGVETSGWGWALSPSASIAGGQMGGGGIGSVAGSSSSTNSYAIPGTTFHLFARVSRNDQYAMRIESKEIREAMQALLAPPPASQNDELDGKKWAAGAGGN